MKYKNKAKYKSALFIFAGLFVVFSLQSISGLGITPARTTINFQPDAHSEVSFSIINSEHKDMSVVFFVRGDMADLVTLSQTYAEFSSSDESKSFTYTLDLPQKIQKPGLHEIEIVALETPKNIKDRGVFIGATVSVVTQIHIYVPYPNKYLDAAVNVVESDKKMTFLIPMVNRGKLDIVSAKAIIDIYSGNEEKIDTLESNEQSLLSLERRELYANWDADVNPGRYKAIVTVRYDNEVTTILKEFNVGEMFLEVLEINIQDFQLGGIAKFDSLVENRWSSDLKDVFLNIIIYNLEGEVMADFKSPNYNVKALSKSEMVAYWDTAGVRRGTYDGKLLLKYGEKSTDRNIQVKITDNSIEVIGLTGHVIVKKKGAFNLNNLLIIAVIFLILVNIIWFVIVKRLIKKK